MDFEGVSPIGSNVARYRKAVGMSAADLAEAAQNGLTRSVIANLENGRKDDVTVRQLMALSAALMVPPVALLADCFRPGAASIYPVPRATPKVVNADVIQWVGGHDPRLYKPDEDPAGKLANSALVAIRRYLTSVSWLRSTVRRFGEVRNTDGEEASEEKDYLSEQLQYAAESVLDAIAAMKAANIEVDDYVTEEVHKRLASVGTTYSPVTFDDPFRVPPFPDAF